MTGGRRSILFLTSRTLRLTPAGMTLNNGSTIANGSLVSTDGTLLAAGRPTLSNIIFGNAAHPVFGTTDNSNFNVDGNLTLANGGTLNTGASNTFYFGDPVSTPQNIATVTADAGGTLNLGASKREPRTSLESLHLNLSHSLELSTTTNMASAKPFGPRTESGWRQRSLEYAKPVGHRRPW